MLRNVASKVMWVGRATVFLVGLAVILALVLGVASTALGSNGQAFLLGRSNLATAVSTLVKQGAGPALDLQVNSGPPLAVNSSTRVTNLNADQLDGKSEADFYAAGSKVADSDLLDGKDSAAFLGPNGKAADSELLDGKDSTEFLGKTEKAADSDKLDGIDSSGLAKAYKRTVVVSPVGTDIENGTALKNALAGITDASATKPYLLYIEPGTYDLGTGNLQMKPHVDVQGAGELHTLITSESSCGQSSTLYGANDTEVRFLTVRATGTGLCSAAIFNDHVSSRLTHVTAEAIGAGGLNHWGVFNESPTAVKMTDVTATASGGSGLNFAVDCLRGANISLTDVTATASGSEGNQNIGVRNLCSNSTMTDVTATASGGTDNQGVTVSGSGATITDVTATASGGTFSTGLQVLGSDTTITDVTATASGGTASGTDFSSGMSLLFATDATVRQSKISGSGAALTQSSTQSSNNSVALSQIVGPIQSPVPLQCFNNYDENLAEVTCPQ